jgi:hypothetical protein
VENFFEARISGATASDQAHHESERDERPDEPLDGVKEGHEPAGGDLIGAHQMAAVQKEDDDPEGADRSHEGEHRPPQPGNRQAFLEIVLVDALKRRRLHVFEGEAFYYPNAGKARLHAVTQLAECSLVRPGEGEHELGKSARDHQKKRQDGEGGQGELAGYPDRHGEGARQSEGGVHGVEHGKAEKHPYLCEVVRGATHDLARGHLAVECGTESVQAVEQDAPELVFDVAPPVENENAREDPDPHGDERDQRQHGADDDGLLGLPCRDRFDAGLEASVEAVGQRLVDRKKQRPPNVGTRMAPKLREEPGGNGFCHLFGVRRGDRLFLERVVSERTSLPRGASGLRCELWSVARATSRAGPRFSKRTRADRSPNVTRAPPLPSSSLMTPTRPANGPPNTRTLAPTSSAAMVMAPFTLLSRPLHPRSPIKPDPCRRDAM